MARFTEISEFNSGLLKPSVDLPLIQIPTGEKGSGDYLDQLKRMTEAREAESQAEGQSSVVLDPFRQGGFGGIIIPSADALLSPAERALAEARCHIKQENYEDALGPLEQVLEGSTNLAQANEARYYQGYCHFHLKRPEEALKALKPLEDVKLSERLITLVSALRSEIRNAMIPTVMLMNLLQIQMGQIDKAITQLRHILELDATYGLYHFMMAGNLMTAERYAEAKAAVARGERYCEGGEAAMLADLKQQITLRDLELHLEPARKHYLNGNYPRARSAVEQLTPEYREMPLCRTFYTYLETLGGSFFGLIRGKSREQVRPAGSFKEIDALHFFLVGSEIRIAKGLMAEEQFTKAKEVLEQALKVAPHFPYTNHLSAICLYRFVGSGQAEDLDSAILLMDRALKHAKTGASDKEISGSDILIAAIEQSHKNLQGLKRAIEKRTAEAKHINAAIAEFHGIMKDAENGMNSPEQFKQFEARMKALKLKLPKVCDQVVSSEGKEALNQLVEAIDANLKQFEELKGDLAKTERIEATMTEFTTIMEKAKGGISTVAQFREVKQRLETLQREVRTLLKEVKAQEAQEMLKQLSDATDRNLTEISKISETDIQEAEILARHIAEFHALMASIEGGIKSRNQLDTFATSLRRLSSTVSTAKNVARSQKGRQALEDLNEAIRNAEQQLPE